MIGSVWIEDKVLKEQWYRAVRMDAPMSSDVLSVTDRLEQTMRRSSVPFFADGFELTWSVQCQQVLTSLHSGNESLVGMPEVPSRTVLCLFLFGKFFLFKQSLE